MGYIVIFQRLAGIPNVALLVRPMVHIDIIVTMKQIITQTLNKCEVLEREMTILNTCVKCNKLLTQL